MKTMIVALLVLLLATLAAAWATRPLPIGDGIAVTDTVYVTR